MLIEEGAPPQERIKPVPPGMKGKYADLLDVVKAANGKWINVDAAEITGTTNQSKRATVAQRAKARGMKIQATTQDGRFYIRLK